MDERPFNAQKAASSSNIPRLCLTSTLSRSVSYPQTDITNDNFELRKTVKSPNERALHYDLQVKQASTGLVNDSRMASNSQIRRRLLEILMETEQNLKKNRRKSLNKEMLLKSTNYGMQAVTSTVFSPFQPTYWRSRVIHRCNCTASPIAPRSWLSLYVMLGASLRAKWGEAHSAYIQYCCSLKNIHDHIYQTGHNCAIV